MLFAFIFFVVYTVNFVTGLDSVPPAITQSETGETIILPQWQDTINWSFVGWSLEEIESENKLPEVLPAGAPFVPTQDTQLWAIYSDRPQLYATTDYSSGDYLVTKISDFTESIAGAEHGLAIYGEIIDGELPLKALSLPRDENGDRYLVSDISKDMIYTFNFMSDSTLAIQHTRTGKYVGYDAQDLASIQTLWKYRVLQDLSIAIYCENKSKTYALYYGLGHAASSEYPVAYLQQVSLKDWKTGGMYLYPAIIPEYTSWPFGKWNDLQNIIAPNPEYAEYKLYIGTYVLYIKNGKKYLQTLSD